MSIKVGSNIESLRTQRFLGNATQSIMNSFERLSSGQRINRASDDAAGLAIASQLGTDQRVYTKAISNVNDTLSLLSIAEGSLGELTNIVVRQKELAEQSANGVYSSKQREALNNEAAALVNEYNRILATTKFNGIEIFNPNTDALRTQIGYGTAESILVDVGQSLARSIGNGTFQSATNFGLGGDTYQIATGDLNGDGKEDIVASLYTAGRQQIFLGNGDGTFLASGSYSSGADTSGITLYDINGDGKLDALNGNYTSAKLHVSFGNGDGTFAAPSSYSTTLGAANAYRNVALGDINGDGKVDAVIPGYGGNAVSILYGNGNGTFKSPVSIASNQPQWVDVFDVNSDGRLDFITAENSSGSAGIHLNNGDGSFSFSRISGLGASPQFALGGDINNDGYMDIITGSSSDLRVSYGQSDGSFKTASRLNSSGQSFYQASITDVNGDGYVDIIASEITNDTAQVYISNGNGTFLASTSYAVGANPYTIALADFDRDGAVDIATGNNSGTNFSVLLGNDVQTVNHVNFNLLTASNAREALTLLDTSLQRITNEKGAIGSAQSRLSIALRNVQTVRENYAGANARITDIDVASETSLLVRAQILQKASTSILAQANLAPQIALTLLRG